MDGLSGATDLLQLFGEPTRVRLLSLLARRELSVADLVGATELPQSRVSQHLGRLREAGVVRDRRDGTSTYYALSPAMPERARAIWALLDGRLRDRALADDRARLERRLAGDAAWPDALAGQMERHYSPGRTWESLARAFATLLDLGDVLDVGSGDGAIAELYAPRARAVTLLDRSEAMVAAARRRLVRRANVACVVGDAAAMPFPRARFDRALLVNVLVFVPEPAAALREAGRVLRRGGEALVVTLDAHAHGDVARAWGHAHRGFSPAALRAMMRRAGFDVSACEVTSRERRAPRFGVVTARGRKR